MDTHNTNDACPVPVDVVAYMPEGDGVWPTRVLRATPLTLDAGMTVFERYRAWSGLPWLSTGHVVDGVPLGLWMKTMRTRLRAGKLPRRLAERFVATGPVIDARLQQFIDGLWHLKWHAEANVDVVANHECEDGFGLGVFLSHDYDKSCADDERRRSITADFFGARKLSKVKVNKANTKTTPTENKNTHEDRRPARGRPKRRLPAGIPDEVYLKCYSQWVSDNNGYTEVPTDVSVDGIELGLWFAELAATTGTRKRGEARDEIRQRFPHVSFISRTRAEANEVESALNHLKLHVLSDRSTTARGFIAGLRRGPLARIPLSAEDLRTVASLGLIEQVMLAVQTCQTNERNAA